MKQWKKLTGRKCTVKFIRIKTSCKSFPWVTRVVFKRNTLYGRFFVGTAQMAAVSGGICLLWLQQFTIKVSHCKRRNPTTVNRASAARTAQGVIQGSGYRSLHQNKNCSIVYINYIDYIDQPTAAVKRILGKHLSSVRKIQPQYLKYNQFELDTILQAKFQCHIFFS